MRKVLAIYLDGYEQSLGRRYMGAGDMPAMAQLQQRAAHWLLDHGSAQRTGLAGEHVATGLSPEAAGRWAAVEFDPQTYGVCQVGTELTPFPVGLTGIRTVVFDPPYFNLDRAPQVCGLVNWGAHDPGVATASNPPGLQQEMMERFGDYPAKPWIYGFTWPSPQRTQDMGEQLARAVDLRSKAAHWLLTERLPDWDLALVTVSEPHSAIEGLWHGVDETHPLHGLPSAALAAQGLRAVYGAVDRLVGELSAAFPDAMTVVVSMGGMGPNRSDVSSMLLLPELLYRETYGQALFQPPAMAPPAIEGGPPLLPPEVSSWDRWVSKGFVRPSRLQRWLARLCSGSVFAGLRETVVLELDWMAARAYQAYWPKMRWFALPSFYDGRVRINLQGRERDGRVRLEDYAAVITELENLLQECVDPLTGETVVDYFEYPHCQHPLELGPTESDLVVVWKGSPLGLQHPRLGCMGPLPFRRTGGHSGPYGIAYVSGEGVMHGERGVASAFDVVPTLLDLLGIKESVPVSGQSLFKRKA